MLGFNNYWRTKIHQRYHNSIRFLGTTMMTFCMLEAILLGLGNLLGASLLFGMVSYTAILFSILLAGSFISLVVLRKKLKQMVRDGSIEKEQTMAMQANWSFPLTGALERKVCEQLKLHPRMSLASLAAHARVRQDEIEEILINLLSNGTIKGHVDPGTGDFVSGMVDTTRVTSIDECPHCGSSMKSALVRGTTTRCESCGQLIVVNSTASYLPLVPVMPPVDSLERRLCGLVKLHPRMSLTSLAARAGVTPDEIEDILVKLVSNGALKGHVDPGTREFISGMVDPTRVTPIDDNIYDCPHCGSPMKSAPVRGTTARCESCGQLIVVR